MLHSTVKPAVASKTHEEAALLTSLTLDSGRADPIKGLRFHVQHDSFWRSIVLTCACGMQQIEECLPMAEKVREAVPDLVSFFNCQGEQPDM